MLKYQISDHIGKRYGYLTVVGLSQNNKNDPCFNHFDFKCDCGNIISDEPARIIGGHRTSCGKCHLRKKETKPRFDIKNYIGKKVNSLTVIGIAERKPNDKSWYLECLCDCGNITRLLPYQFDNGKIKSCGCIKKVGTRTIDNRTKNPLYGTWSRMIDRCENPKDKKYEYYGGRGIMVCDEWHNFFNFVKWSDSIGGRPEGFTLDRINNDGNYEPSNCRWATRFQQATNKSSNIILEFNGESKTLIEWSMSTGIKWHVLWDRFQRKWPVEEILTVPVNSPRPSNRRPRIGQYDLSGNLISLYVNSSFIPNEFNKTNINACCHGKRKSYKGYVWKFEGD